MSESLPSAERDVGICAGGCGRPASGRHWRNGRPTCPECFAHRRAEDFPSSACACPPCPGRGNDGHGLTHCAECCFGSGVEADPDCPTHGLPHCEGWTCQSCGADNFIPAGFARILPPGERKTFAQYAAERAQNASPDEVSAIRAFDALYTRVTSPEASDQ